ncbi:ABC-ATPase domain-containing protein [Caldalkalibacillus mannanilyticus]|uniref:ABC-ATPase domain-containing protein n=1 Tax=Caldalkalibacillus mannanilyticus TaxID=1418 RepID=UPI00046B09E6|nr:ABC-ATPase domain-containing protein [Caldalkalibacillus mannanilyticus]
MSTQELSYQLLKLEGKGYKAYKDIQGSYQGEGYQLFVDYVQGDPFASPSRIRMKIPQEKAKYPKEWFESSWRKTALEDYVTRQIATNIRHLDKQKKGSGTGKSGLIHMDTPGQEVLPRTSVLINEIELDVRMSIGLPAAGRRILGKMAEDLLCRQVPALIERAIFNLDREKLFRHLQLADQQVTIRSYLKEKGFVSFIANGSILPRESGVSNRPLRTSQVVPFQAPKSLEIEIPVPHTEPIRGMGIAQGITLIVGGGYHGKSTLLKGIERGVYNHIPGDGREYVITDDSAFKIRAEDGRRVEKVNISPFISNLPFKQDTSRFSTEDASGSTSQAANIMEALEIESKVLLIDEDTSATNFMIRDERMRKLVAKEKEPITPFIDRVRELYDRHGVSSVLVIGGTGAYFDVADHVIMLDEYVPCDVTEKAKEIAEESTSAESEMKEDSHISPDESMIVTKRVPLHHSFQASRGNKEKVDVKRLTTILYGVHEIDLTYIEQLVDPSQTRAIADMMRYISKKWVDGERSLVEIIEGLYLHIEKKGLDCISPYYGKHPGDLALPRKYELAAAMNRLRTLKVK